MPGIPTPKQLGQGAPGTVQTTIATIDANSRGAVGVTVTVCNINAAAQTYRIYRQPSGGTARYIAFGEAIASGGSRTHALSNLSPGEIVGVYGSSTDVQFIVDGIEIT